MLLTATCVALGWRLVSTFICCLISRPCSPTTPPGRRRRRGMAFHPIPTTSYIFFFYTFFAICFHLGPLRRGAIFAIFKNQAKAPARTWRRKPCKSCTQFQVTRGVMASKFGLRNNGDEAPGRIESAASPFTNRVSTLGLEP